jgi:hypothetical protein
MRVGYFVEDDEAYLLDIAENHHEVSDGILALRLETIVQIHFGICYVVEGLRLVRRVGANTMSAKAKTG